MRYHLALMFASACALAAGPAATPATAAADLATRVLAPDGDVYAATEGRYGDLFPDGTETLADDPVLVITVIHPDGVSETWLVPATAGPAAERLAALVLGPDGETLYVLWQSSAAGGSLRLAHLGTDGWGDAIDVSRAVPVLHGSPRAVVTRDSAGIPGESPSDVHRSVLHVVWLEDDTDVVIYAPLVIEDGAYIGDHPLFDLGQLVGSEAVPGIAPPPAAVSALAPTLEPGDDPGAVVAGFTLSGDGRIIAVDLRMVDNELSRLGNGLREEILVVTRVLEPGSPDSLAALARGARDHLLTADSRLQPMLLDVLATEIERYILSDGTDWAFQPEAMAERTRRRLVEVGSEFDHTPIRRMHDDARPHLIGVGQRWEGPFESHDLRLRVTATRPAPHLPEGAAGSLFLSGDGEDALVAWERDGVVFFRESDAAAEGGWGPVRSLGITAGEDSSLVRDLLRQRVRGR